MYLNDCHTYPNPLNMQTFMSPYMRKETLKI